MSVIMSKQDYAEQNGETLLGLESIIIAFHKKNPRMHDHDVIRVLEALIKYFRARATNFPISEPKLSTFEAGFYFSLKNYLEVRIEIPADASYTLLKFLKNSVEFWNKEGGSQGYLTYISCFIAVDIMDQA